MSFFVVAASVVAAAAVVVVVDVVLINIISFYFTWSFQFDAIFHIISHFISTHARIPNTQSFWLYMYMCLRHAELKLFPLSLSPSVRIVSYKRKSDALRLGHERQSTQLKEEMKCG